MYFVPLVVGCGSPTLSLVWGHCLMWYSLKALHHLCLLLAREPHIPPASSSLKCYVSVVLILRDVHLFRQGFGFKFLNFCISSVIVKCLEHRGPQSMNL